MTTDRPQLPPAYWANQIRADLARRRAEETAHPTAHAPARREGADTTEESK